MAEADGRAAITRRQLLTWAGASLSAGLTASVLSACTTSDSPQIELPERASCVRRDALRRYSTLGGLPLVYEVDGRRSPFWLEPAFAGRLESWLPDLAGRLSPAPDQLWTYGTWTSGGSSCSSWHNAGRAFDLARIRLRGGEFVSCRYDSWQRAAVAERDLALRRYWAVAAGLHLHFAHVLTYLYNAQHHNHIHVDNGRSGGQRSTFRSRSGAQVQAVQAMCTHLWESPVPITGRWDAATRRATRDVLERLGSSDALDSGTGWSDFLAASAAKIGSG